MSTFHQIILAPETKNLFVRFWRSASGFWCDSSRSLIWGIMALLLLIVLLDLLVKYLLNIWTRDFFNALARRDAAALWLEARAFLPLAAAHIALAVFAVWGRMTLQRKWRAWLTEYLIKYWIADGSCHRLTLVDGDQRNPEYRIVEDARVATDAPIDFAVGLVTAALTAVTFIYVLWQVGGDLSIDAFGQTIVLPEYLVIAAVIFPILTTSGMIAISSRLILVIKKRNQVESELRYEATRLRESGQKIVMNFDTTEEGSALRLALGRVIKWWRELCWQLMRTTFVSQGNVLLAPVVPLLLCAPKYLNGTMSLGEVTQAAAAFVIVQSAFNWLVDNYPRFAEWIASVQRVGALLVALDHLKADN